MKLNWKYLRTAAGKMSYAVCVGDRRKIEFSDVNLAYHYEKDHPEKEFEVSIDELMLDQKATAESKRNRTTYGSKIDFTDAAGFRALQRKLDKEKR